MHRLYMVLILGVRMTGQSMPAPLARAVVIVGAALGCVFVVLSEDGVEVELKMSMCTPVRNIQITKLKALKQQRPATFGDTCPELPSINSFPQTLNEKP